MGIPGGTTGTPVVPVPPGVATLGDNTIPGTLLSLEEWREVLGFNPWHFWGFAGNTIARVTSNCNGLVFRYAWQNADAAGRENIRRAIETAEKRLPEYYGFNPAPLYQERTMPYPGYAHPERFWLQGQADFRDRWRSVRLEHDGYIQEIGLRTREAIAENATVSYADLDGDGLNETFTVSVAGTTLVPGQETQVKVYFAEAQRFDGSGIGDRWEVRPVDQVNITAAGDLTIRGRAWLLGKPILYEGIQNTGQGLDPTDADNFAPLLDVYREYLDPDGTTITTSQAVLLWETLPYPYDCCCTGAATSPTDPASVGYLVARVGIRNADLGIVFPGAAIYDADAGTWSRRYLQTCWPPTRVTMRYKSGYAREGYRMAAKMRYVVARFAAAELRRPICACDSANRELYEWQFDLARAAGKMDEQFRISEADLNNPFGTRRGEVFAWKEMQRLRILGGFAVG